MQIERRTLGGLFYSFIQLKSPQTVLHGSHGWVAADQWAVPASPLYFILDQGLMGKLFPDLFPVALSKQRQ